MTLIGRSNAWSGCITRECTAGGTAAATNKFTYSSPLPKTPVVDPNQGKGNGPYTSSWVAPGRYVLKNCLTGTVLDLYGGSSTANTPVVGWEQLDAGGGKVPTNQQVSSCCVVRKYIAQLSGFQWDVISGTKGYKLKNVASGTYLAHPTNVSLAKDVQVVGGTVEGEWEVKKADECYVCVQI